MKKCDCKHDATCKGNIKLAQVAWKDMLEDALRILEIDDECHKDIFVLTVALAGCSAIVEMGIKHGNEAIYEHMSRAVEFLAKQGVKSISNAGSKIATEPVGPDVLWSN